MFTSQTSETKRIADACLAASVSGTWQAPVNDGRLHPFYGEAPKG